MINKILLSCTLLFIIILGSVILLPAGAQAVTEDACAKKSDSFLGFPTWYKYLWTRDSYDDKGTSDTGDDECNIEFNFPNDTGKVLLAVVEILLRVAGMVAVGFVIYGGFRYILSQGDPEQNTAARSTIINALIGIVIATIATVIVSFVARNITKPPPNSTTKGSSINNMIVS